MSILQGLLKEYCIDKNVFVNSFAANSRCKTVQKCHKIWFQLFENKLSL